MKKLSRNEMRSLKGGYVVDPGGDGAIACKSDTTKCKFLNFNGTWSDGKCATAPASGPRLAHCGCKVGEEIQNDDNCKQK